MRFEFSNDHLEAQYMGHFSVKIVTVFTLIFQIFGPIMSKYTSSNVKEFHLIGNYVW